MSPEGSASEPDIQEVRRFWDGNPMTYDWRGDRIDAEPGTLAYFAAIENAMRADLPEHHDDVGRIFGDVIDHDSLDRCRLLEVGSGMGLASAAFAASGAEVVAVDLTERGAAMTREVLARRGLRGVAIQGDALALPFRSGSFDKVWSWGVIHHTPDPARAAREIRRVLRPGGSAIVMVYNRRSLLYLFQLMLLRGLLQGRLRHYTPEQLAARYTDGASVGGSPRASHYSQEQLRALFPGCQVRISTRGQISEVFPRIHRKLVARLPGARPLAERLTRHWGWFLVAEVRSPLAGEVAHSPRPTRVGVVSEIPTPYKAHELQSLAADPRLSVEALLCAADHPARGWGHLRPDPAEVRSRVLPGLCVNPPGGDDISVCYVNPTVVLPVLAGELDVLLLEGWNDVTMILAAVAARLRGIPYVVRCESHERRPPVRIGRRCLRWLLQRVVVGPMVSAADGWVASGVWAREYLGRLGAPVELVTVVPLLPELAAASPPVRRAGPLEPYRVLFLGRAVEAKGLDLLLRAIDRLVAEGRTPVELVTAGGERDRVAPEQVPALLAGAHVLVLPSSDEPWGMVVIEALAAGVPVIVSSRVGCSPEMVAGKGTGEVFPVGDLEALVEALRRFRDDPAAAAAAGDRGRQLIERLAGKRGLADLLHRLGSTPHPGARERDGGHRGGTRRARVGYVNPFQQQVSGPDESLLTLIKGLDRSRYEAIVYLPGRGRYLPLYEAAGAEVRLLPMFPLRRFRSPARALFYVLTFAWRVARFALAFRRDRIDLVHTNMEVVLEAAIAGKLLSLPTVTHVRGNAEARPTWFFDLFFRVLYACSSAVLAISNAVAQLFERRGLSDRLHVVHNAVDTEAFTPGTRDADALREEMGASPGASLVGMVGRFHPRKGLEVFVDAASLLAARHPDAHYVVVGEAEGAREVRYLTRIRDRIMAYGLRDKVTILGPHDDIPMVMTALDVLVLPSLEEGFGRVVIEAMAMCCPVVASNQGGPAEIIEHGTSGILFEPESPVALADAVAGLLGDPVRSQQIGQAGRARVVESFSLDQHVPRIEAIYQSLLGGQWGRWSGRTRRHH